MPRRQQPRRDNGPPKPEKVEDPFSPETLNRLAEERMRDIKHIVVYRRRVPSRETVEDDPQTVHVSLDAGGVVGRMLVDNATKWAGKKKACALSGTTGKGITY